MASVSTPPLSPAAPRSRSSSVSQSQLIPSSSSSSHPSHAHSHAHSDVASHRLPDFSYNPEFLMSLLVLLPQYVIHLDANGKILYFNKPPVILQRPIEELVSCSYVGWFPDDPNSPLIHSIRHCFASRAPHSGAFTLNGQELQYSITPRDEGVVVMLTNIPSVARVDEVSDIEKELEKTGKHLDPKIRAWLTCEVNPLAVIKHRDMLLSQQEDGGDQSSAPQSPQNGGLSSSTSSTATPVPKKTRSNKRASGKSGAITVQTDRKQLALYSSNGLNSGLLAPHVTPQKRRTAPTKSLSQGKEKNQNKAQNNDRKTSLPDIQNPPWKRTIDRQRRHRTYQPDTVSLPVSVLGQKLAAAKDPNAQTAAEQPSQPPVGGPGPAMSPRRVVSMAIRGKRASFNAFNSFTAFPTRKGPIPSASSAMTYAFFNQSQFHNSGVATRSSSSGRDDSEPPSPAPPPFASSPFDSSIKITAFQAQKPNIATGGTKARRKTKPMEQPSGQATEYLSDLLGTPGYSSKSGAAAKKDRDSGRPRERDSGVSDSEPDSAPVSLTLEPPQEGSGDRDANDSGVRSHHLISPRRLAATEEEQQTAPEEAKLSTEADKPEIERPNMVRSSSQRLSPGVSESGNSSPGAARSSLKSVGRPSPTGSPSVQPMPLSASGSPVLPPLDGGESATSAPPLQKRRSFSLTGVPALSRRATMNPPRLTQPSLRRSPSILQSSDSSEQSSTAAQPSDKGRNACFDATPFHLVSARDKPFYEANHEILTAFVSKKLPNTVHSASIPPHLHNPLVEVYESLGDWHTFDIFYLSDLTNGWPLSFVFTFIMYKENLFEALNVEPHHVFRCIQEVEANYSYPNPYHTSTHAADVVHACYCYIQHSAIGSKLSPLEKFALIFAAGNHDVAHPGVNNSFLVNSKHTLATIYSDRSVLESFHAATCFRIMQHNPDADILSKLAPGDYPRLRKLIIDLILATDLAEHFRILGTFKKKLAAGEVKTDTDEDRALIMQIVIKSGDLSHPSRPRNIHLCFPESDTRILTNHGWLFLDQIEALIHSNVSILYAAYDQNQHSIQYVPGELAIRKVPSDQLLTFASQTERKRWNDPGDWYGKGNRAQYTNRVTIRVTPDHDMFVNIGHIRSNQYSFRNFSGSKGVGFQKYKAGTLGAEDCTSDYESDGEADKVRGDVHVNKKDWTEDETKALLEGYLKYGKKWKTIRKDPALAPRLKRRNRYNLQLRFRQRPFQTYLQAYRLSLASSSSSKSAPPPAPPKPRGWTDAENEAYYRGIQKYGNNYVAIKADEVLGPVLANWPLQSLWGQYRQKNYQRWVSQFEKNQASSSVDSTEPSDSPNSSGPEEGDQALDDDDDDDDAEPQEEDEETQEDEDNEEDDQSAESSDTAEGDSDEFSSDSDPNDNEAEQEHQDHHQSSCLNCRGAIQFVTRCVNGHRPPQDESKLDLVMELQLYTETKLHAFLEYYGFWVGDGSLQYPGYGYRPTVVCRQHKQSDIEWLEQIIPAMGLTPDEWFREDIYRETPSDISSSGSESSESSVDHILGAVFTIRAKRFSDFFDKEYGSKYKRSKYYNPSQSQVARSSQDPLAKRSASASPSDTPIFQSARSPPDCENADLGELKLDHAGDTKPASAIIGWTAEAIQELDIAIATAKSIEPETDLVPQFTRALSSDMLGEYEPIAPGQCDLVHHLLNPVNTEFRMDRTGLGVSLTFQTLERCIEEIGLKLRMVVTELNPLVSEPQFCCRYGSERIYEPIWKSTMKAVLLSNTPIIMAYGQHVTNRWREASDLFDDVSPGQPCVTVIKDWLSYFSIQYRGRMIWIICCPHPSHLDILAAISIQIGLKLASLLIQDLNEENLGTEDRATIDLINTGVFMSGYVRSAKWLAEWALHKLSPEQSQLVLRGVWRADGNWADQIARIISSSAHFRDQLTQLILHCGYGTHFILKRHKGAIVSYKHKQQHYFVSVKDYEAMKKREQIQFGPIRNTCNAWNISWNGHKKRKQDLFLSRKTDITSEDYNAANDGRQWCVTVKHADHLIIVQRAFRPNRTQPVTKAGKPIVVGNSWAALVTEEFFQQGDKERALKLPQSMFMDRHHTNLARSQIGFIEFIVLPLFTAMGEYQGTHDWIKRVEENLGMWKDVEKKEEEREARKAAKRLGLPEGKTTGTPEPDEESLESLSSDPSNSPQQLSSDPALPSTRPHQPSQFTPTVHDQHVMSMFNRLRSISKSGPKEIGISNNSAFKPLDKRQEDNANEQNQTNANSEQAPAQAAAASASGSEPAPVAASQSPSLSSVPVPHEHLKEHRISLDSFQHHAEISEKLSPSMKPATNPAQPAPADIKLEEKQDNNQN